MLLLDIKCTLPLYCLKESGKKDNLTFESLSKVRVNCVNVLGFGEKLNGCFKNYLLRDDKLW